MMVYYLYIRPLFQIFTQSLDAIDVTSVTLSRLNSINAIDVTRYLGDIFGISLGYLWDIFGISLGYLWDIFCRSVPPEFLRSFLILTVRSNKLHILIIEPEHVPN